MISETIGPLKWNYTMQILVLDVSGNHVAYHSEFALVDYDDYVYVELSRFYLFSIKQLQYEK